MGLSSTGQRRLLGAVLLAVALAMLIAGQTILEHSLRGRGFFLYWLICVVLTGAAVFVALQDARASRIEIRRRERELLEETIREIQADAENKKAKRSRN